MYPSLPGVEGALNIAREARRPTRGTPEKRTNADRRETDQSLTNHPLYPIHPKLPGTPGRQDPDPPERDTDCGACQKELCQINRPLHVDKNSENPLCSGAYEANGRLLGLWCSAS